MEELIKQEKFEIEVLEKMKNKGHLKNLIFCGGTMLRLCYGLNRYSLDLDFWLLKKIEVNIFFDGIKDFFASEYILTDASNKFHTLLFEIKSKKYPKKLKIEIRKEEKNIKTEKMIAFSKHSNIQVIVDVPTLQEMLNEKIITFIERKEIRDAFDIEFITRRGILLSVTKENAKKILETIESLKKVDYNVKLGSILEKGEREYYKKQNFNFLKTILYSIINRED